MVKGDAKQMNEDFIHGASFTGYGTSLYVGVGVPIPLLDPVIAEGVSVRDREIKTEVIDYGIPRRDRGELALTDYEELKSGAIYLDDNRVKVSSLSSLRHAEQICSLLKKWIDDGKFTLTSPVERLPPVRVFKPMKQSGHEKEVVA
jgi:uncharacterized protein (DUF39 family)